MRSKVGRALLIKVWLSLNSKMQPNQGQINICKSTSYFQNFSYIQCFKTTSHIILRFLIPSGFCLQFVIILTSFSISNWFPLFRGAISQKINYKLPYYWLISVFWCDYLNFWVNLSNSFTICHRTDIFQYFNLITSILGRTLQSSGGNGCILSQPTFWQVGDSWG